MISVVFLAAFVAVCLHTFHLIAPPEDRARSVARQRRLCPVVATAIVGLALTVAGVHVADARDGAGAAPSTASGPGADRAEPEVKLETLPAQPAIVRTLRAKPDALAGEMARTILSLIETAGRKGLDVAGPPFARYVTRGDADQPFVVEVGLPIAKPAKGPLGEGVRAITLPGGPAATVVFTGRHEDLARGHAALDRWLKAGKRTSPQRWEVYLTNPITTPDPAAQQTKIVATLARS